MGASGSPRSILAGYPWFTDWGRDTMIALPGLLLTTGRHELARRCSRRSRRTWTAACCRTCSPTTARRPSTTPWTRRLVLPGRAVVLETTDDQSLLEQVYPALEDIGVVRARHALRHRRGPARRARHAEARRRRVALTWMDARVEEWSSRRAPRQAGRDQRAVVRRARRDVALRAQARPPASRRTDALGRRVGLCVRVLERRPAVPVRRARHADGTRRVRARTRFFAVSLFDTPLDRGAAARRRGRGHAACLTSQRPALLVPGEPGYRSRHGGDRRVRDGNVPPGHGGRGCCRIYALAHFARMATATPRSGCSSPTRDLMHAMAIHVARSRRRRRAATPRGASAQAWTDATRAAWHNAADAKPKTKARVAGRRRRSARRTAWWCPTEAATCRWSDDAPGRYRGGARRPGERPDASDRRGSVMTAPRPYASTRA